MRDHMYIYQVHLNMFLIEAIHVIIALDATNFILSFFRNLHENLL